MLSRSPVVSVAMLAYNHEKYIVQAIESVLAQRVDFPLEIVVGEDGSTDGTRALVERLAAEHPERIRPMLHPRNLGMHGNSRAVLEACSGRYVALLEGDDYWTDPEKLALQVAALEADPTLVGCYHLVKNVADSPDPGEETLSHFCYRPDHRLRFQDLLWSCGMSTCSVMFRRAAWREYPDWLTGLAVADWPIFLLLAKQGDFLFLPRHMADYRHHQAGSWSSLSRLARIETLIRCYLTFRDVFGRGSARFLGRGLAYNVSRSIRFMEACGDPPAEIRRALEGFLGASIRLGRWPAPRALWWWARLRFPRLHSFARRVSRGSTGWRHQTPPG